SCSTLYPDRQIGQGFLADTPRQATALVTHGCSETSSDSPDAYVPQIHNDGALFAGYNQRRSTFCILWRCRGIAYVDVVDPGGQPPGFRPFIDEVGKQHSQGRSTRCSNPAK